MDPVEFLEALARVADEVSLPPYVGAFPKDTKFTQKELRDLPLHYKLEALIV